MASGGTAGGLGLSGVAIGPPLPPTTGIASITADSRLVEKGGVFAALEGSQGHGIDHLDEALKRGAVAVLCGREGLAVAAARFGTLPVPFVVDGCPRRRLAVVAAALLPGQPGTVVAVTGTNGKTSCVEFLRKIWEACGLQAASVGTLGAIAPDGTEPLDHTTPDPVRLHGLLASLAGRGISHLAMEASSHALEQHRVDAVALRCAVATNLSRDHHDYHGDVHSYAAAKLRLFLDLLPSDGCAAGCADDPFAALALDCARARGCQALPVGWKGEGGVRFLDWRPVAAGQEMEVDFFGRRCSFSLPFAGQFQATNAMLAAAAAVVVGLSVDEVEAAVPKLTGVPGRMELVARCANGAAVYVDFAHTPDALEAALMAARSCAGGDGRVHVVVGAGGCRDLGKRVAMGEVTSRLADRVIVTDDNPRDEDPASIRREIRRGAPDAVDIGDRRQAIEEGVAQLAPKDVLVVAGKGHERVQIGAGGAAPFDDSLVAREAVAGR